MRPLLVCLLGLLLAACGPAPAPERSPDPSGSPSSSPALPARTSGILVVNRLSEPLVLLDPADGPGGSRELAACGGRIYAGEPDGDPAWALAFAVHSGDPAFPLRTVWVGGPEGPLATARVVVVHAEGIDFDPDPEASPLPCAPLPRK